MPAVVMAGAGETMLHIPLATKKPVKQLPSPTEMNSPIEKAVYHQLLPDFPSPSIEFVKHTPWIGPIRVPLDSIETENRKNWVASREPEKVQLHQKLISQGQSEPIILAKLPGHDKFFIIDAHHRFLAYEALQQKPLAYIGDIRPDEVEAAMTAHSKQYSGQSKLSGPEDSNGLQAVQANQNR